MRWGRMPMHELIQELVPDPTARAFYQHLTGANFSDEEGGAPDTSAYQATANVGVVEQASSSDGGDDSGGDVGW